MTDPVKNRLTSLSKTIVDSCLKCKGHGYLINKAGEDELCQCMTVFRWIKALVIAGIGSDYWHLSVDDLKVDDWYKNFLKNYFKLFNNAVEKGKGVLFLGINGVGKTAMACEIGKFALVQGKSVFYTTNEAYIHATQKDDNEYLSQVQEPDVLILDELEKAYMKKGTNYVAKKTEELIRMSLQAGKILVIGTNATEEELREMFGDSTLSAMNRHLAQIAVSGTDYSDKLQKDWLQDLRNKYDFYHPNILSRAIEKQTKDIERGNL